MDIEDSTVGFVPLRSTPTGYDILLVLKRKHGMYGFPKGHREAGETDLQTGRRELMEESGCVVELYWTEGGWSRDEAGARRLPDLVREYPKKDGTVRRKTQWLFVGIVREVQQLEDHGEIEKSEWLPLTPATADIFERDNEREFFLANVLPLAQLPKPT